MTDPHGPDGPTAESVGAPAHRSRPGRWSRLRRIRGVPEVLGASLVLVPALLVVLFFVVAARSDAELPRDSDLPPLPAGMLVENEPACGSGSCWRTLLITDPAGRSVTEVLALLGGPRDECHTRGFLDFRELCVSVGVSDSGDQVEIQASLSDWY